LSARDDLAKVIAGTRFKVGTRRSQTTIEQADAILAAGYRKPRTITTVEELDALPAGSMILDSDPDALLRTESGGWYSVHVGDHFPYSSSAITHPATVFHEPGPTP
jgi:hypothetical protein